MKFVLVPYLAIPMRAQPFHVGHQRLLARCNELTAAGLIFLNQELDGDRNIFTYNLRVKWVTDYLKRAQLSNLEVAQRDNSLERQVEYLQAWQKSKLINCFGLDQAHLLVVTTPETDQIYRQQGFQTVNHHVSDLFWRNAPWSDIPVRNLGAKVRFRLAQGLSCQAYLSSQVEEDSVRVIRARDRLSSP